jgi:hypothetical protein
MGGGCIIGLPRVPMRETVIFKTNIDPGVNNLQVDMYIVFPTQVSQYVIQ